MRLNLNIKDDLYNQLKKALPPRRVNQFVNRAIMDQLDALKREQLEKELKAAILRMNKVHIHEFEVWEQGTLRDGLKHDD